MSENQSAYRNIFKSTSLFGGVQVITVFISIIRSKFIALLLGPSGIGVFGLLNSTMFLIAGLTNFGIERSAVKNVAESVSSGDVYRTAKVISVIRRLVLFTGILGAVLTFIFSSFLSKLTFGNDDYTIGFRIIAITLLLNQISAGEKVVLRGMRQLKFMAQSTLWGSITGLCFSIPIYYYYRLEGIIPAILISSISTLIISFYFSKKVKLNTVRVDKSLFFIESKDLLKMGLVLSLSSLIVLGESYLVRMFIRLEGGIEDVGFYNAGFAILNSYFGVVFTALTIDYYPKLVAVASDNVKATKLMNQQSEMTLLLISPLLSIFLVFVNLIVVILYSKEFTPIAGMMMWAVFGIYFKAVSWSLGVIFISKGDVKTLFWSELGATSVMLILNLLGYYLLGLEGLGISFFLAYLYAYIQNFLIVKIKYSFSYSHDFYKIFITQLVLGIGSFSVVKFTSGIYLYTFGIIIFIVSLIFSLKILDKKMNILSIIKEKLKK